jgi:hypothetical protein
MRRYWSSVLVVSVSFVLLFADRASAQSAETQIGTPSFEVGATAGALVIFPTFGVRAAVNLSPRFALEGAAEYVPWILDDRGGRHFILQGQLRHIFHRGQRWNWHGTYGGSFFAWDDEDDSDIIRIEAGAALFGIGAEYPISRRVSIRWDAQAIQSVTQLSYPIPRGTIGVTWR